MFFHTIFLALFDMRFSLSLGRNNEYCTHIRVIAIPTFLRILWMRLTSGTASYPRRTENSVHKFRNRSVAQCRVCNV